MQEAKAIAATPATTATCAGVLAAMLAALVPVAWYVARLARRAHANALAPGAVLVWGGAAAWVLVLARRALTTPFEAIGRRVLTAKNVARPDRVKRFATVCFKTCYYVGITAAGFALLRGEPWFPRALGGAGHVAGAFDGWPYHASSEGLRVYYQIQFGYHLHSGVVLATAGWRRNDRTEMAVHHAAAVLLLLLSWCANWLRIGALVLFVHDVSDIFTYGVKIAVDTPSKLATGVLYLGVLASWLWFRLWALPFVLIRAVLERAAPLMGPFPAYVFAALLSVLVALHVYWFVLILDIGRKAVSSGDAEDTYQRPRREKED